MAPLAYRSSADIIVDPGAVAVAAQGQLMTFLRTANQQTANQQGADAIGMLVDLARAPTPRRRRRAHPAARLHQ